MEPKTTLNLLKYFFSDIIQETILLLLSSFEKIVWYFTFGSSHTSSIVSSTSINFAKAVFKINITKTDQSEAIKSAPPEIKYFYA